MKELLIFIAVVVACVASYMFGFKSGVDALLDHMNEWVKEHGQRNKE